MMIDSQGGAFSKRPNILYSKRPKGRFLYGSRRSHTLDLFFKNSLSFSLSLSLSLERDKKKKIVLVVKWGGETQNKNKNF